MKVTYGRSRPLWYTPEELESAKHFAAWMDRRLQRMHKDSTRRGHKGAGAMTLDEIKKRTDEVRERAHAHDSEVAHAMEDDLYRDLIAHIAKTGSEEQRAMAEAVLATQDFNFNRWYA